MDADLKKSVECLHSNYRYQTRDGFMNVICDDCRVIGPGVKIGWFKTWAKSLAMHQFLKQVIAADEYFDELRKKEGE